MQDMSFNFVVYTLWTWLKVTVKSREDFLKLKMKRLQLILSVNVGWKFNSKCESQWKEEDWAELFRVMLPDSSPDL